MGFAAYLLLRKNPMGMSIQAESNSDCTSNIHLMTNIHANLIIYCNCNLNIVGYVGINNRNNYEYFKTNQTLRND